MLVRTRMRRTPGLIVVVLLALAACATSAQARVVSHDTGQSQDRVARYWTSERMREAVPASRDDRAATPKAAKGGTTSGATSIEVATPYPPAHGKVFFTDAGVNYVCSGTAIASVNESVVWTAGHCVNEGPGAFVTNFMFVPAYRDGAAPYGRFAASRLHTTSGWQGSGEFGVDLGAAVVGVNESGVSLNDAIVGERSLVFNATRNQSYKLYGYPAAKRFSGQRMRLCDTAWSRDDTSATPDTMGVPCDMTGGSSGGAWVTSDGAVASVISYGYNGLRNVLFGPHQESAAQQLFGAAETSAP
jgi:V8-like Glu-specific endopeptidase